jgi:thioredoxin-like negative regulator of GroEL
VSDRAIHIVCLCAAWCRTCDEYAPVLAQVSAELAASHGAVCQHWIDIEDEAELVGDFDVETFPTLVVIGPDGVRFAGPLTPQPDTLRRVLRATVADAPTATRWPAVAPEIEAFAARLRARFEPAMGPAEPAVRRRP